MLNWKGLPYTSKKKTIIKNVELKRVAIRNKILKTLNWKGLPCNCKSLAFFWGIFEYQYVKIDTI